MLGNSIMSVLHADTPEASSTSRVNIAISACVAGCLAFAVLLFAFPGGARAIKLFDDIAGTAVTAVVGLWCIENVIRTRSRSASREALLAEWIPLTLGATAVVYAVGHGIRTYCDLAVHDRASMPGWVNAGYLLLYPLLLLALLKLPQKSSDFWRGRVVLDSLMTITALVTFSWYYVLGPAVATRNFSLMSRFSGASYPFADLILTFCLLVFTLNSKTMGLRNSVRIACIGLLATCVADVGSGYMVAHFGRRAEAVTDIGWPLGYGLIAFAGLVARREILLRRDSVEESRPRRTAPAATGGRSALWRVLLPYAFVPPLIALVAYVSTHDEDRMLSAGVYVGSCMLLFLILVRQVFVIVENNKLTESLREAYRELQNIHQDLETQSKSLVVANERLEGLAATDGMTGLANHRKFQERIREELENHRTLGRACSLLLLDVDHFKQYNDTFGHPAGDVVLKTVARLAFDAVRPTDLVARYGGEEFAVILLGADTEHAVLVAERIRTRIASHEFPSRAVTVSIGACSVTPNIASVEEWIAAADSALYAAKHGGRNRVETSR